MYRKTITGILALEVEVARVFDDALLETKISRKEFLRYMLGIVLVVVGISNFIAALRGIITTNQTTTPHITDKKTSGFGASKFGV